MEFKGIKISTILFLEKNLIFNLLRAYGACMKREQFQQQNGNKIRKREKTMYAICVIS